MFGSSRNMEPSQEPQTWTADSDDLKPWVELELSDRSNITGKIKQILISTVY